jgi:hypothetical protein
MEVCIGEDEEGLFSEFKRETVALLESSGRPAMQGRPT